MSLREKLFQVVFRFEGGRGFENLSWNFDGQGASLGCIQFAWGQGNAQRLLKACAKKNPAKFKKALTQRVTYMQGKQKIDAVQDLSAALLAACDLDPKGEGLEWIVARQVKKVVRGKTVWQGHDHWQRAFEAILQDPEFQQVQLELAESYWKDAVEDFLFYKGETVGQLLFCLDVAIQNGMGKIGRAGQKKCIAKFMELGGSMKQSAASRFKTLADAVASTALEQWQADVRKRKYACLNGTGVVHGYKIPQMLFAMNVDVTRKVRKEELAA